MTLRQFGSVGELLVKLKADLEAAFPSFFREFLSSKVGLGQFIKFGICESSRGIDFVN